MASTRARMLVSLVALAVIVLPLLASCSSGDNQAPAGTSATATSSTSSSSAPSPTGGASSAGEPKYGGVFRIAQYADLPHLDPHETISFATHDLLSMIYSRLLKYKSGPDIDPNDWIPEPDLAEKWEQPNDTTYIFYLRKGVKWHNVPPVNGRELTAEDVKYSFERITAKEGTRPSAWMFNAIDKIETPDNFTVKFILKEPFAPFMSFVSSPFADIVPKEAVTQFGDLKQNAIGSGPFVLKEYIRSNKAVLTKNPDYFIKGRPYLDGVEYLIIPDVSTRKAAFRTKDVDYICWGLSWDDWQDVKKTNPDAKVEPTLQRSWWHIYMRDDQPPFNDARVRQAVALAIDRQAIMDTLGHGEGKLEGPLPAALKAWALPVEQLAPYYKRDVPKAKKLLADAGYPNGLKVDFWSTAAYGTSHSSELEMIKEELKEAGIDATIKLKEYAEYISTVYSGQFEGMAAGPQTPMTDPDEWLYGMHHPKGSRNHGHVDDPKLTPMLEQQRKLVNVTERKKLIDDIQKYIAEQQFYVSVIAGVAYIPYQPYVKNFRPTYAYGFYSLTNTWLDKK